MWCKKCEHETNNEYCELCNSKTEPVIPTEVFWCKHCKTPVIVAVNEKQNCCCPLCGDDIEYLASDLRPVFRVRISCTTFLFTKFLHIINYNYSTFCLKCQVPN